MATSGSFDTTGYLGRYLQFQWSRDSYSIENNTTTINWYLYGKGEAPSGYYESGNFKVTTEGKTIYTSANRIQLRNGTLVASGQYTYTHDTDGSKSFSVYVEAGIYYYAVNCSGTGNFTLDTIPRASQPRLSDASGYFGNQITIYTDTASQTFKHKAYYNINGGSWSQVIDDEPASGSGGLWFTNSCIWTIDNSLMNSIPNSVEGTVNIKLVTYSDSTFSTIIGEKTTSLKGVVRDSIVPSIGNIIWTKASSSPEPSSWGLTQQVSSGTISMVDVSGAWGSTITAYALYFDKYSSQSFTLSVPNIQQSGTLRALAIVRDSRNRTYTKEVYFTVAEYSPPKIQYSVYRCDSDGTENPSGEYISVTVSATIEQLFDNAISSLIFGYRRSDSSGSPTTVELSSGVTVIKPASSNYSWDWYVTAKDVVSYSSVSGSISTGEVVFDIRADGKGIGFGKVSESSDTLELDWNLKIKGNLVSDFVVEQGKSGVWYYRKWLSGKLEQWAIISCTFSSWLIWGNDYWYYGTPYNTITFGIPFSSSPVVNATSYNVNWAIPVLQTVTNSGFEISGIRPELGVTDIGAYWYSVYAVGEYV